MNILLKSIFHLFGKHSYWPFYHQPLRDVVIERCVICKATRFVIDGKGLVDGDPIPELLKVNAFRIEDLENVLYGILRKFVVSSLDGAVIFTGMDLEEVNRIRDILGQERLRLHEQGGYKND